MKILISIFRLYNIGGIESSVINLINEIKYDHEVSLCVLTNKINDDFSIPKGVNIIKGSNILRDTFISRDALVDQSFIEKLIRNIRRFKRRILGANYCINNVLKKLNTEESFDVAIAFINNKYNKDGILISGGDYDYVIKKIKAKRKIAWIHADPHLEGFNFEISNMVFEPFDAIVNVSKSAKRVFDEIIPKYKYKSYVVYNMYNIEKMIRLSTSINPYINDLEKLHFVTVSRIDNKTKRLDRIIKVCSKLRKEGYNNFNWTIVGDGPDYNELSMLIKNENLSNTVTMIGAESNPYPYMKFADLYISTSDFETFGMSVREAQILGCPVLITDIGPSKELVEDNVNGLICDNSTNGLTVELRRILNNTDVLLSIRESLNCKGFSNDKAKEQFNKICN